MERILEKIDYKKIFYYFEEISKVPRGSENNQGISDYLVLFAKEHDLKYTRDEALNVIIIKEATKGYENSPAIILQGHMDMVCEKNENTKHDFLKEGLKLIIEGDYIFANNTTLGGDDGIALAYSLALLDDNSIKHPRLEIIFTTDEEIGMEGANALDVSELKAVRMINLDSEEEGIFLSSSAGGMTSICELPIKKKMRYGNVFKISVVGLQGGHSGTEIQKNRSNANLILGRILYEINRISSCNIVDIFGGLKDNAIPREAFATILIKDNNSFKEIFLNIAETIKKELMISEPELSIDYESIDNLAESISKKKTSKIIDFLINAPNGVQVMSDDISGLVESSLNLGILRMTNDFVSFSYSVRSSKSSYRNFINEQLKNLITLLGGCYTVKGVYPAWEYKPDSDLRKIMLDIYRKNYGKEPIVEAIHAGLECGIISDKIKDLDIVSMGPDIFDIHTPKEKLSISSTIRVYDYLVKVLEELK